MHSTPRRTSPSDFVLSIRRAFAALCFLITLSALHAATYYVATNGNDSNAGTQAAPFATIMRAQTAAVSGDTVYVRSGTYATFAIAATDSNYNYVHRLNKAGVNWSAYPGETPVFDFSSVPTNLRVCGFHVTGTNVTITGFVVTGVKDGTQKQSECFRIDGSAAICDFYDCVAHDNAANGFYFTNHARGSCTRCDSYNNIGTNGDSIGNTDGFGAHGDGVAFHYCRSWHNSDDGYDCISSNGSNTFDHCWAYNMTAGGDSNGFKVGGYGSGSVPSVVPVHTVMYCLSANNNAHGFYANHQPGQAATWTHNTSYNHTAGNFDMLERVSPTDATDIPGYREVLHYNVSFAGTLVRDDADPAASETDNSWTKPGVTVAADDFVSLDASQMTAPRSAGNNMPFITFMHLTSGSDLAGMGCFDPAPAAPTNVQAAWINSGRVDISWTASPDATEYYVKRATTSGGPYTTVASRVGGTSFSDTSVGGAAVYYYVVSAMNGTSFDEAVSTEASASKPPVAITGVATDTGVLANDGVTSDTTLVLSGTALPGSTVSVSRSDIGAIGTIIATGGGTWSFDYTGTALADGAYSFQATATPPSSSIAFTSDPFAVTVDTSAPAAPTIALIGGSPLTISGSAEPLGIVTVLLDGSPIGSATANAAGMWSFGYGAALSAGSHTFIAVVNDVAGNASPTSASFTINTNVSTPAITGAISDAGTLANGAITSDKTLSLTGTAGAGDSVTVTRLGTGVIGNVITNGSGNWTFDYTGTALPDGISRFYATASNGSGTGISSPTFMVTVDSIAPTVVSDLRQNPTGATITSAITAVVFRVTFSEPVSGVDVSDFTLTTTNTAAGTIASVSANSGTTFDVTVNNLSGSGTLRLDLNGSGTGITDAAGNVAPGYAAGDTYTRVISTNGSGTWIDPVSGGLWSDAGNWLNAVIPDGTTHAANFATLDIVGTNIVHLDTARTINSATFGDVDTTTAGSWFIDNNGVATNTLTLGGTTPTLNVGALTTGAAATIGARLVGTSGMTKAGAGTLVLTNANAVNGALAVSAGTLRLGPGGSLAQTTVAVNTGGLLDVNGGSLTASGTTSITGAANTSLTVNDGTAALAGVTFTSSDGAAFRVNGGSVTAASVTVPRSTDSTIRYTAGFIVTGGTATVAGAVNLGTANSNGVMSIEGGALTVNGVMTIANQTTGGRGGAMRVIGGTFTSTNTALGIVMSKTNGANANNVSTANFLGGISTVEKFTLGFDSTVTLGSATITVDGGTLYLGSGGIVKNGASGFATNLNFSSGTIGAKANWSTALNLNLPAGGNITLKTADAADAPFSITLNGIVGGAGGFTKTGGGTLTLDGAGPHTYSGVTNVNAGALRVTSTLATSANGLNINSGGALTGNGTVNRPINLNNGGTLAPDGATAIATLNGASLTWNGGGTVAFDLADSGNSDALALAGALTQGDVGTYTFAFTPGTGFAAGNTYTLVTFGSTTFTDASAFSATGLSAGTGALFQLKDTSLQLRIQRTPTITSPATAAGIYAAPFSYTATADDMPATFGVDALPPGLALDATSGVVSGPPAAAGVFHVLLTATNTAGSSTLPVTITIAKAVAPVVIGSGPSNPVVRFYTGSPVTAPAATSPAGLNVTFTYNGLSSAPTLPGSYDVIGTIDDPNYDGTAGGTLQIVTTALVRHGTSLSGDIDGSMQILLGESTTLNGGAGISSDLLVPGTPRILLNGSPTYGGTVDAAGAETPSNYFVILNSTALLRHVVRRVDPIAMPTVAMPPAPTGTRDVVINNATQVPGDFATLRNLTLNRNASHVVVPTGTYGTFIANSGTGFVLGVADATEPAVYNLQGLVLNNGATVQVVGPVILTLAYGTSLNSAVVGDAEHPEWLALRVANGGVILNSGATLNAIVTAPSGTIIINTGTLNGRITADSLMINSHGLLNQSQQP